MSRFSSRLAWHAPANRISALVAAKRAAGAEILDLTESNPTQADLLYPSEIVEALADPAVLKYEPDPAGLKAARTAVAEHTGVVPERIFLTASTSEAYAYLFKLLADPGDEILTPRPSYPLFEFLASLESVRVAPYPLEYHGQWSVDFDGLRRLATPRARAVVIVNPNNPTGSFLKRGELERLTEFCLERRLAVISDEVFSSYGFGSDARRVASLAAQDAVPAFCLNGLSKLCGLPQMKLGWISLAGPAAACAQAFERLEWIADTYLSVGTPVQCAAARLLDAGTQARAQIAARTRRNLESLRATLAGSACDLPAVEGGWYAPLRVPGTRTDEEWCLELLGRDGVLVQPGFFYDFASGAYLVLSLLTPEARFDEGLRRLLARVETG